MCQLDQTLWRMPASLGLRGLRKSLCVQLQKLVATQLRRLNRRFGVLLIVSDCPRLPGGECEQFRLRSSSYGLRSLAAAEQLSSGAQLRASSEAAKQT